MKDTGKVVEEVEEDIRSIAGGSEPGKDGLSLLGQLGVLVLEGVVLDAKSTLADCF